MTRRGFDRFMVDVEIGRNLKLRPLTDSEWRAFVGGVLPIAAKSTIRGLLLIGERPAEDEDVALQAGVKPAAARAAMKKLRELGMLYRDDEYDCERVHDFEEWNPAPKKDATNAQRQQRYRERLRASRNAPDNAVTNGAVTRGREEKEEEKTPLGPPEGERQREIEFEEWIAHHEQTTGHQPPRVGTKARQAVRESFNARRTEGIPLDDLKLATIGAHADDYRREHGYDVAESVLRPTKVAALIAKGKLKTGGRSNGRRSTFSGLEKAFPQP